MRTALILGTIVLILSTPVRAATVYLGGYELWATPDAKADTVQVRVNDLLTEGRTPVVTVAGHEVYADGKLMVVAPEGRAAAYAQKLRWLLPLARPDKPGIGVNRRGV